MASKAQLLALADRVEREEPSDDLSEAIAEALGWANLNKGNRLGEGIVRWVTPDKKAEQRGFGPPAYTTSLDAAVTLVPGNATWEVAQRGDAEVTILSGRFLVSEDIERYGRGAKTPAMALCAAALRAIAATKGE